jgi:hypothetical protein
MPYPYMRMRPGGIWSGRRLLVVGAFARDAIISHIQINLRQTGIVRQRADLVSHPDASETGLGVKKTAREEVIRAAEDKQKAFEVKRSKIAANLDQAVADLKELEESVAKYRSVSNQIVSLIFGLIKNLSPLAFLTWVIRGFSRIGHMPWWQGVLLCSAWIIIYNLLGLLGMPFHDASYRKYLLFEGYIGTPSDGVKPLSPNVARLEEEFYKHLGIARPIVVSWDDLIPPVHYAVTALLITASFLVLPLSKNIRGPAALVGLALVYSQVRMLVIWRKLMRSRFEKSGLMKLIVAASLNSVARQEPSK